MRIIKNMVLSFVCVCLFPVFISDHTLNFSNSYFSILFWVLLYMLLQYTDKQVYDRRMLRFTYGLGFLFSFMTACGYALEQQGTVGYRKISFIVCVLLYTHIFALLLAILWTYLERVELMLQVRGDISEDKRMYKWITWIFEHPVVINLILLICWTPCYISTFPGGFCYDATPEFEQIIDGIGYNENFPMLHSVLITRILSISYKLCKSYNAGIVFYTICQMILMALLFTCIIYLFYRKKVNKIILTFLMLYCALFPVIHILVTHTVRDVLFSALLTCTIFLFYLLASDKISFMNSVKMPFLLGIMFVLTMLARNNNTGVITLVIVFGVVALMWIMNRKGNLRGVCIFAVSTIGGYFLLSLLLLSLCQPRRYLDTQKGSLSVFAQCIARAYAMELDGWTEEEEKALWDYFDMPEFYYVAENADPAKTSIRFENGKSLQDFFGFWFKIGLKHPGCYLDAVLANTKKMWFPGSVIDGYIKVGGYQGFDKCYFYFGMTHEPGISTDYLPKVENFYKKIGLYLSFEKIPIISMLFSIGFQFWLVLNCFFYVVYRRCRHLYLPLTILLGYAVISAFVPLVLLRYFSALFFAFPMTVVFTLQPSVSPIVDYSGRIS